MNGVLGWIIGSRLNATCYNEYSNILSHSIQSVQMCSNTYDNSLNCSAPRLAGDI